MRRREFIRLVGGGDGVAARGARATTWQNLAYRLSIGSSSPGIVGNQSVGRIFARPARTWTY